MVALEETPSFCLTLHFIHDSPILDAFRQFLKNQLRLHHFDTMTILLPATRSLHWHQDGGTVRLYRHIAAHHLRHHQRVAERAGGVQGGEDRDRRGRWNGRRCGPKLPDDAIRSCDYQLR